MAEVNKYGRTSPFMKVIGKITKPTEEGDLSILMETFIKENGKMTKLTEKVFTIIMTDPVIMENGMKMFRKVLESKNGLMDLHMKGNLFIIKDNIIMGSSMVTVNLYGLTYLNMKANSIKIKFRAEEK